MAKPTDRAATATKASPKARAPRRANAAGSPPTKVAKVAKIAPDGPRKPEPASAATAAPVALTAPATPAAKTGASEVVTNAAPGRTRPNGVVSAPPAAPVAATRVTPPVPPAAASETKAVRQPGRDGRAVEVMAVTSGRVMLAAAARTQQFANEQLTRACTTTRAVATCGSLPAGLVLQTQYLAETAQSGMAYALELAQLASDFWRPSQGR